MRINSINAGVTSVGPGGIELLYAEVELENYSFKDIPGYVYVQASFLAEGTVFTFTHDSCLDFFTAGMGSAKVPEEPEFKEYYESLEEARDSRYYKYFKIVDRLIKDLSDF